MATCATQHLWRLSLQGLLKNLESRHCEESAAADAAAISYAKSECPAYILVR